MCGDKLFLSSQERALEYLTSCIDQVHEFNDILQLVIVELVYKVCVCVCVCVRGTTIKLHLQKWEWSSICQYHPTGVSCEPH